MKKTLLLFTIAFFSFCAVFSQSLYSSTSYNGSIFDAGLGQAGTPVILFDDVLIPSSLVAGSDSVSITKVKFGIARFANSPAVTIRFYYTVVDDTATLIDHACKIPPVMIDSVVLPANGGNSIATIYTMGDSINSLFKVKTDTGNAFPGYQTLFLGMSFSEKNSNAPNGWLLTDPGTGQSNNLDVMWVYDRDDPDPRYATNFGGPNPPVATFYMQVFGKGLAPLPVTLTDFNARRSGRINLLNWTSQEELNTKYYVVERSTDGRTYSSIGQVVASGGGGRAHNYNFTDENPSKGTNYYRLRITDKDNTAKLSAIRSIRNLGLADVSIYPNPVRNMLNVAINADRATDGHVSISDLSGQVIYSNSMRLASGSTLLPVNVSSFSAGSYVLKIQMDDDVIVKKFNKQ